MEQLTGSNVQVGPEVDYFAQQLDTNLASRIKPSERRSRIFKLVDLYYGYCSQRLMKLEKKVRVGAIGENPPADDASPAPETWNFDDGQGTCGAKAEDADEVSHWRLETHTWDLLRRILPLRYRGNKPSAPKTFHRPLSREDYLDAFFSNNPVAHERKTVMEWLQTCADTGVESDDNVRDLQRHSERGDIMAYGWIHTRSAIKKTKIIRARPGVLEPGSGAMTDTQSLVTQLDPDAVTRQEGQLQKQDQFFERAIWIGCYNLLRRGKSPAEIREWARERTEAWRAVSILAFSPFHSHDEHEPIDPAAILLWSRMAQAAARRTDGDDYERAVYGILSGDLASVEKVSRTWDDVLFAHYNALLRKQLDDYLIDGTSHHINAPIRQAFPAFKATQFHGDVGSLSESIAATLGPSSALVCQPRAPLKALQAAIVTDKLDDFMVDQGLVLSKSANLAEESKIIHSYGVEGPISDNSSFASLDNHRALRLIAHVYIVVNALEELECRQAALPPAPQQHRSLARRREVQQNVVAAYAMVMRIAGFDHLIPMYCSKLAGPRAYEVLSRNLIHIIAPRERNQQLELMRKFGLDPAKFVEYQSGLLLDDVSDGSCPLDDYSACSGFRMVDVSPPNAKYGRQLLLDFTGEDPETIDKSDDWLIRAMEWLLVADGLWEYTLEFGTRLYKYFLGHLKLSAARALAERVPCSSLFGHKAGILVPDDGDSSWFKRLETAAYGNSGRGEMDNVAVSPPMVSVAKPYWELECLARMIDITETISALIQISREDPSAPREFWSKVGDDVKLAKGLVKPLLHQWLTTGSARVPSAPISQLREAFLPEVILGYLSVLHFAGTSLSRDNLLECLDLAAYIADEGSSDIAALFVQCGRMKELLEVFAACSKAVAVWGGEKTHSGSAKRLKDMGWSRELWSANA